MKRNFISSLFFMGVVLFSACNTGTETETDSKEVAEEINEEKFDNTKLEEDAEFVVKAADGGLMEEKLGQLALTNAGSSAVKQFGQMMIDDHSKANAELKTLAASKSITLPDSLSDQKRNTYDELAKKKGNEFDKDYMSFMVDDHKEDISLFKKAAENAKDSAIKTWAAGKVATLEHHLKMAETTRDGVK